MRSTATSHAAIRGLEQTLGYSFQDKRLLQAALTADEDGRHLHQSLEFLGDRVVNLCIAKFALERAARLGQGLEACGHFASHWGANLQLACAFLNRGLDRFMLTKEGRLYPHVRHQPLKVYADVMEAIFGALAEDTELNMQIILPLASGLIHPPIENAAGWELNNMSLRVPKAATPVPPELTENDLVRLVQEVMRSRIGKDPALMLLEISQTEAQWIANCERVAIHATLQLGGDPSTLTPTQLEQVSRAALWALYLYVKNEYGPE